MISFYENGYGLGEVQSITFSTQPNSDWSCNDWMIWHKALVQAFVGGKFASGIKYSQAEAYNQANKVFNQWWDKMNSFFSSKIWCGYNSEFYNYFKSVGNTAVLSFIASLVNPLSNSVKTVANTTEKVTSSATQTVENVADTAKNTTETTKWVLPVLVVGAIGLVGTYLYKNYIKGNSRVKVVGQEI